MPFENNEHYPQLYRRHEIIRARSLVLFIEQSLHLCYERRSELLECSF